MSGMKDELEQAIKSAEQDVPDGPQMRLERKA